MNVRSLYRSGSLKTVARELAQYRLGLVGIWRVKWDKDGTNQQTVIYSSVAMTVLIT